MIALWLLHSSVIAADFNSIYIFGDGVSNTNHAPTGVALNYHENRFCNGRVYVEVLSNWQGLDFGNSKNFSNFGNDSSVMLTSVNQLVLPTDAADSLFIIWSNNADYVNFTGEIEPPWTNPAPWNAMANASIANHIAAVTTLYQKGARKIVMPNAVDVTRVPLYNAFDSASRSFARQRIITYNQQFKTAMADVMFDNPGLEILVPDTFSFFDQVLTHPGTYGMVNFSDFNAGGIDSGDPAVNGAGANYVFWDDYHPTAKFQMHLAAFFQQIISPVKVSPLTFSAGSGQLAVSNIPLGRAGVIEGSATLAAGSWQQDAAILLPFSNGGSTAQSFNVPASGPRRFYRASFPVVWVWP